MWWDIKICIDIHLCCGPEAVIVNKELTLPLLNNNNNNNNNNNKSIHIMHFVPPFPSIPLAMKVDRRFLCAITKTYLYNFDPLKPHF